MMDVLSEILKAIDPGNKEGLKQEVIDDLVEQCQTYKQRVVNLVYSTKVYFEIHGSPGGSGYVGHTPRLESRVKFHVFNSPSKLEMVTISHSIEIWIWTSLQHSAAHENNSHRVGYKQALSELRTSEEVDAAIAMPAASLSKVDGKEIESETRPYPAEESLLPSSVTPQKQRT